MFTKNSVVDLDSHKKKSKKNMNYTDTKKYKDYFYP